MPGRCLLHALRVAEINQLVTFILSVSMQVSQGYREDDGLYLESDTDEQLLIHIPFNQGKLHLPLFSATWCAPQSNLPP